MCVFSHYLTEKIMHTSTIYDVYCSCKKEDNFQVEKLTICINNIINNSDFVWPFLLPYMG